MTVPGVMHGGMLTDARKCTVDLPYLIPRRLPKKYVPYLPRGDFAKTKPDARKLFYAIYKVNVPVPEQD